MTRFLRVFSGMILLTLVLSIGIACAAEGNADLNVTKAVSSTGPYGPGDEVTWVVTLWNNGPARATNISLAEEVSGLSGLVSGYGIADYGTYNNTTRIWNISELDNDTFTTLTVVTTIATAGTKTNTVRITALDQTDPEPGNNRAEANVLINAATVIPDTPLLAHLIIKPTTLNLKSKGIFTVFITLTGKNSLPVNVSRKSRIDYANSSLTCSGAEMVRASVSDKDKGTLIARFHRQDLENVTSGEGVRINCSGTLFVDGKGLTVEGSDTIRVIGERKGVDALLSRLWKFLGVEKDDVEITQGEDGNLTVTFSVNPDTIKNYGQSKKMLKNNNNESDSSGEDTAAVSDQTRGGKENPSKTKNVNKQVRQDNSDNKPEKDNNDSEKRDDQSPGKSYGKKNT
jgi:hypothetical protein